MLLKMNSAIKTISFLLFMFFLGSCEEGPFGFNMLGRGELELKEVILEADSMAFFGKQISLGKSVTLIGGRDSLTEMRILFSVDGFDSIAVFDSVKLMIFRYRSDTLKQSNVVFRLYPLTSEWNEDGCTWVLADAYTKWLKQGGDFDSSKLIAEINIEKDTTSLMLDSSKLSLYRKGFVLIPQNDGFVYLGSSQDVSSSDSMYKPQLWGFREEDTIRFENSEEKTYYAKINDACIIKPYEPPNLDTLIGSAYSWRVFVHFPLDTLGGLINITSADLQVGYNNYFSPEDSLYFNCYRLSNQYEGRFSETEPVVWGRSAVESKEHSLSFSVTELIQYWVDVPDSNFGLLLSHSYLSYNPNPSNQSLSQDNRIYALGRITGVPKLVITYTDPPEGRFKGGDQ